MSDAFRSDCFVTRIIRCSQQQARLFRWKEEGRETRRLSSRQTLTGRSPCPNMLLQGYILYMYIHIGLVYNSYLQSRSRSIVQHCSQPVLYLQYNSQRMNFPVNAVKRAAAGWWPGESTFGGVALLPMHSIFSPLQFASLYILGSIPLRLNRRAVSHSSGITHQRAVADNNDARNYVVGKWERRKE